MSDITGFERRRREIARDEEEKNKKGKNDVAAENKTFKPTDKKTKK